MREDKEDKAVPRVWEAAGGLMGPFFPDAGAQRHQPLLPPPTNFLLGRSFLSSRTGLAAAAIELSYYIVHSSYSVLLLLSVSLLCDGPRMLSR